MIAINWDVHTTHPSFWLPRILTPKNSLQLQLQWTTNQLVRFPVRKIHSIFVSSLKGSSCVIILHLKKLVRSNEGTLPPIHMVPWKMGVYDSNSRCPLKYIYIYMTYQHFPLKAKVLVITNYARKSNLGDTLPETTPLRLKICLLPIFQPLIFRGLWHVSFRKAIFNL